MQVKKMICSLLVALICLTSIIPANASWGPMGGKLINGIDNVLIYVDSSRYPRATYWQNLIEAAVNNWMYTGYGPNDFYGYFVTSNNGSNIDIYGEVSSYFANQEAGIDVLTRYMNNDHDINQIQDHYYYVEVHLNDTKLSTNAYTNAMAQGVVAFAIGRCFGMKINNDTGYSILAPTQSRYVQTVQQCDNDMLNSMY